MPSRSELHGYRGLNLRVHGYRIISVPFSSFLEILFTDNSIGGIYSAYLLNSNWLPAVVT
jgi:hypothetical protein